LKYFMKRLTTIQQAAADIQQRRRSCLDLLEQCLSRIEEFEPRVQAWVSVDAAGARETAQRLDDELKQGRCCGPLHGIPLGIKDIIDVAGWPTKAGSPLRESHRAERDAPLVARLREAGAIILGKTVTTQFASFDPAVTRNPWNLQRTPGGSSSGSAAAVAAGMCLGAIGSQTGGSITRPASFCGAASCKPTLGRVSCTGVVPFSYHLDHPGPMARSVADVAIILRAIAVYDASDPVSVDVPPMNAFAGPSPEPPRLGLLEPFFLQEASAPIRQATEVALAQLRAAGATVEAVALPPSFADVHRSHWAIMAVDAADYHRAAFPAQRDQFGPNISRVLDDGLAATAIDYASALACQLRFRRDMAPLVAGFDALVTPATVTAAPGLETTGDPKFNSPWSYSGLPTVSVPCGLTDEQLPASLQFVGRPFDEASLLRTAAWCEQSLDFTAAPPLVAQES
jgi:aspartyl-tRNA(Asn)/glutamyl-tRNA(Gln) amidotransferase subunit A